ncbi:MAG TPA: hypothetical protein DIT64_05990 [Verrucomicrobiales bacterium]|nr:hypothetical protein [Verrucomicrobiales bacterium]
MKPLLAILLAGCAATAAAQDGWLWIDDGLARLGVDLKAGACIGWFSRSGGENLLNTFDAGRYLQQSYYGDEDGSDWNGKPWRYNPVQGGSWRNEPSAVIEQRAEAGLIYAKTRPRHWATGKVLSEIVMEQWLRLENGAARMKFRVTHKGGTSHAPRHQELPALFVQPVLDTLVFAGAAGALVRKQPGFPNEYFRPGKGWAAWVDARDQGIGIWCPHAELLTCYRVRAGDRGDCSYLAPLRTFALTPGMVFEYETALVIGALEEMRARLEKMKPARW